MSKSPVLQVNKLTKRYGSAQGGYTAVDQVSFSVEEGEIVGLLGPNGAGKTSTIQMLMGLTTPTSGSIGYFGKDFASHREECLQQVNFASAYSQVQGKLTARESLRIYAALYGIQKAENRIAELLELLEISQGADKLFWHLSAGQKTRVILAKSLLNRPKLLLMDEPTASLDPEIAEKVVEIIKELQRHERLAILYTSHNMVEVEKLCSRVIFLDHGKIIAQDTPLGLTKRVGAVRMVLTFDGNKSVPARYLKAKKLKHIFVSNHVVEIEAEESSAPSVLFGLSSAGVWLTNIDIKKPSLEEVFLSIARGTYEI